MRDLHLDRRQLENLGIDFELEIERYIMSKYPDSIVLHNLTIYSTKLEKDTQLDLVLLTNKCVYVIEAKNWVGYIKGEYNDVYWEGKSRARTNMKVFSPVNQNDIHIRALRNAIRLKGINPPMFKNLVVVPDGTSIKSHCQEVVNRSRLLNVIEKNENISSDYIDKRKFASIIREVCDE